MNLVASRHNSNGWQSVAADACHSNWSQQTELASAKTHTTKQNNLTSLNITANRSVQHHKRTVMPM